MKFLFKKDQNLKFLKKKSLARYKVKKIKVITTVRSALRELRILYLSCGHHSRIKVYKSFIECTKNLK